MNVGSTRTQPERPAWWFLGTTVVELGAGEDGPTVAEMTLPVGASPPLHVHATLDDSFYLIEGRIVLRCGEVTSEITEGAWVPFPHGVPHTFRVLDGPARVLLVHADDSFLAAVRAIGRAASGERPPPSGAPGYGELSRMLAAHGITNVGPSMTEEEARRFVDDST